LLTLDLLSQFMNLKGVSIIVVVHIKLIVVSCVVNVQAVCYFRGTLDVTAPEEDTIQVSMFYMLILTEHRIGAPVVYCNDEYYYCAS